jgi:hypothetical protein
VVATNKENYETGLLKLVINVTPASSGHPAEVPIHSVKLKIDNLNLVRVAALLYCKKNVYKCDGLFGVRRLRPLHAFFPEFEG